MQAFQEAVPRFLRIAGHNIKDITAIREEDHIRQLEEAKNLKKHNGNPWNQNDCLADSLLQLMVHHSLLCEMSESERREGCAAAREALSTSEELLPQHRPQGTVFLQENIHSEPVVNFFLKFFEDRHRDPLPGAGIRIITHSVWNWDEQMCPPAITDILVADTTNPELRLEMHLYNTTHGGISGLHFDPMW